MKTAIRWIILAATIGGGFTGVAILLNEILHNKATAPSYFLLWGLFMGFNLFAIVSGLLFADNPNASFLWWSLGAYKRSRFHHRFWCMASALDFVLSLVG
jgi:ABC-type Fe3+-siderophore transport system permease subunit